MKHSREHWSSTDKSITHETHKIYIKKLFTKLTPRYRFFTTMLSFGRDKRWKRYLISQLPVHPNPVCLDIGCGTGDLTFLLGKKYQQSAIVGIDITRSMLEHANFRNTIPTISFQQNDMCSLAVESNSIDIVTAGYALPNASSLPTALSEIARVLKPGGIFAFLEFSKHPSRFIHSLHYSFLYAWSSMWGFLIHGNSSLYSHIAKNLTTFPDRKQLHTLLHEHNFSIMHSRRFMSGMVEVTVCKKM